MRTRAVQDAPYTVRKLLREDVGRAFALVALIRPDVSEAAWRDHVLTYVDVEAGEAPDAGGEARGARVLVCPNDYFYGLFTYRMRRSARQSAVLALDNFCVVSFTSRRMASAALLASAEALADDHGCSALSITFLDDEIWSRSEPPDEALALGPGFVATPPQLVKSMS